MILLDYSAVAIANITRAIKVENEELTEELALHLILNSIRKSNKKFSSDFGRMVITCDAPHNWRKDIFKHYKYKRKKDKKESDIDWKFIYEHVEYVKEQLDTEFPYIVMEIGNAEADDIIGELARYATRNQEPTVIISNDKDFIQLSSEYVTLFRPVDQGFMHSNTPKRQLKELIIRGDTSDGIPNIKTNADHFVNPVKKQTSIFQKELDIWLEDDNNSFLVELNEKVQKKFEDDTKKAKTKEGIIPYMTTPSINFMRNEQLIDLEFTPEIIKMNTVNLYNALIADKKGINRGKMIQFFMKHRLRYLHEKLDDFM